MKYITLIIGLLVVGCGKQEQADTDESTPTTNTNEVDGTTAKPVKELSAEEKVVGTYEYIDDNGNAHKYVLQESGVAEFYWSDRKSHIKRKWKISKDRELHIDDKLGAIPILTINPDGSITLIADIVDGKRTDFPKDNQITFKKIK